MFLNASTPRCKDYHPILAMRKPKFREVRVLSTDDMWQNLDSSPDPFNSNDHVLNQVSDLSLPLNQNLV